MDLINEYMAINRLIQPRYPEATAIWFKRELMTMDKSFMKYLLSHPIDIRFRDMIYWYTHPKKTPYYDYFMINYTLYTNSSIPISQNYYELRPFIVPDITLEEFLRRVHISRERDLDELIEQYPNDSNLIDTISLEKGIYYNSPNPEYLNQWNKLYGYLPIRNVDSIGMINIKLDIASTVRIESIPRALEIDKSLLKRVEIRLDGDPTSLSKIKIIKRFT